MCIARYIFGDASLCVCVQVCTSAYALLNTLQECGRSVAYMYMLLCACVVWLARPSHYTLTALAYVQQLCCVQGTYIAIRWTGLDQFS